MEVETNTQEDNIKEIIQGSFERAKSFVCNPSNIGIIENPIDDLETYLIYRAARAGNFPLVKLILDLRPDQIQYHKSSNGADVFQHAVISGNLDLVKFLISRGADPYYHYFMQTSILYFALKNNHIHIFKYFVEELKMDPNDILAYNGIQAIYMAMEQNDKELFNYLLKFNPHIENVGPYNYLAYAARMNDSYYLDELLKRNSPFEIMEPYCRSAFSWAGEDNNYKQIELILKKTKGVKPEPLLAPKISKISHEYNALCYKWQRLYDIYMTRYYCELKRKETEPKETIESFIEDRALEKVYRKILSDTNYNTLLFKIPRNIFKCAMKYLDACQPILPSFDS